MKSINVRTRPSVHPWIVGFGALCFGLGALEAVADEPRSVTVSFADLNIENPAGAKVLYQRIQSAARSVCGPMDTRFLEVRQATRKCYQEAITGAVSQVDNETLTALHAAKWKGLSLG